MLVIVSDLHFCDGTASPANISPDAFSILYEDAYDLAAQYHAKNLDMVFLGDVVDLLRTERWFVDAQGKAVPLDVRPWGSGDAIDVATPSPATLTQARAIAAEVIETNALAFSALRGENVAPELKPPCPVRRIFLPGNHDRLYLHDGEIRRRVIAALGATDELSLEAEGVGQHRLLMPRYGLLARHGHEWDLWNFERYDEDRSAADYQPNDFLYTPIGDPITTELIARLPFLLRERLAASPEFRGTPELDDICLRMQRIEDVRPTVAAFRWIFYQSGKLHGQLPPPQAVALSRALEDTVRTIAADFRALDYYRQWRARHHRSWHLDAANKLELVLDLVERFRVEAVAHYAEDFSSLLDRVEGANPNLAGAARESLDALGASGPRFVVYGHTHEPMQAALRADPTADIYLNSGTWRRRQFRAGDGGGFVGWETFSYLVFADRYETSNGKDRGAPAFINWNGGRRV